MPYVPPLVIAAAAPRCTPNCLAMTLHGCHKSEKYQKISESSRYLFATDPWQQRSKELSLPHESFQTNFGSLRDSKVTTSTVEWKRTKGNYVMWENSWTVSCQKIILLGVPNISQSHPKKHSKICKNSLKYIKISKFEIVLIGAVKVVGVTASMFATLDPGRCSSRFNI